MMVRDLRPILAGGGRSVNGAGHRSGRQSGHWSRRAAAPAAGPESAPSGPAWSVIGRKRGEKPCFRSPSSGRRLPHYGHHRPRRGRAVRQRPVQAGAVVAAPGDGPGSRTVSTGVPSLPRSPLLTRRSGGLLDSPGATRRLAVAAGLSAAAPEEAADYLAGFAEGLSPKRLAIDLTPGYKSLTLALEAVAPPGSWLLYCRQEQTGPDNRVQPGSERYDCWRKG